MKKQESMKNFDSDKDLKVDFVLGFYEWGRLHVDKTTQHSDFPPEGFYNWESRTISMVLDEECDDGDFEYHWFDVYHHEVLHHVLNIIDEDVDAIDDFDFYCLVNGKRDFFKPFLPLRALSIKNLTKLPRNKRFRSNMRVFNS